MVLNEEVFCKNSQTFRYRYHARNRRVLPRYRGKRAEIKMKYEFRNVNGHVEVFLNGSFLFSADTKSEALAEIAEMERSA